MRKFFCRSEMLTKEASNFSQKQELLALSQPCYAEIEEASTPVETVVLQKLYAIKQPNALTVVA